MTFEWLQFWAKPQGPLRGPQKTLVAPWELVRSADQSWTPSLVFENIYVIFYLRFQYMSREQEWGRVVRVADPKIVLALSLVFGLFGRSPS